MVVKLDMWIDDQVLKNHDKKIHSEIFVPTGTVVVLGSGNDQALEVNVDACVASNVAILRRYGGGGTVVLYPGCVVVSAGCWVKEQFQNSFYFDLFNRAVIDSLAQKWKSLGDLSQAGISDIVMDGRKVAGTSMFRSRNYLLYQASILVDLDRNLVSGLLNHPTKEPDYRKGRSHKDFLTCLTEVTANISSSEEVAKVLSTGYDSAIKNLLGDHLIDSIDAQKNALTARLARSGAL